MWYSDGILRNYNPVSPRTPMTFTNAYILSNDGVYLVCYRLVPQCLPYNGTICSAILGSRHVYVRGSFNDPEDHVRLLLHDITTSMPSSTEDRCHEAAEKILCQFHFPECTKPEEPEEPEEEPIPVELCRLVYKYICNLLCDWSIRSVK